MTLLRHDRIFHLQDLSYYPGSEWLDMTIYLPWSKDTRRRLWLMIPRSTPIISIDDVVLKSRYVSAGQPRWIDYGVEELPILTEPNWSLGVFHQLRIRGMDISERAASYLVITTDLDLSLEGCDIEQAERKLWGLARCDAGTTMLQPSRVTVGSGATFVARYTAGPKGLPAGALIRFSIPKAFTSPQVENPDAPGFVAITEADCQVSIVTIETSVESHEKIDIICRLESDLAPSRGFNIRYSTEHISIVPIKFHEVDRKYWYSHLPPLSAAVALSEHSQFVSPLEGNGHTFEIVPGPSERLHLFLPGRRFATEDLSLKGTFTDHYRNVPPTGLIDADIELWLIGGENRIPLGSPVGHFVARHRFEVPLPKLAPGVYRVVAYRSNTAQEIARSNPLEIIDEHEGRDRLYWGEIHVHTEMSDGSGEYSELYRHAKEEGCLDFAAASDHAEYFTDNQWLWMQDVTNAWNRPGEFVTLQGYEWEGKQRHRNVYTARSRLKLFRGTYPPTSTLDVVWNHFRGDEEVVGGVHALLAHGVPRESWIFYDPSVERFVEIYSMWGACDFRESPLVPGWLNDWISRGVIKPGMTVNELLSTGAKLGFTGGGDCHEGHAGFSAEDPDGQGVTPHGHALYLLYRCGMTAAIMPRLDRISLIQALRNRRTYATTGARILLDFNAAGFPMGYIGTASEVECHAVVHAVAPLQRVEIIKDGEVVWHKEPEDLDVDLTWQDPVPPVHEHFYYLRVIQTDGQMAWSSPVWIRPPTWQQMAEGGMHGDTR